MNDAVIDRDEPQMPLVPSDRIYRNALEFYYLAKPAFEDNAILLASPNAVVCNLALCVELLLKCSDSRVIVPPHKDGDPLGNADIFTNLRGHDLAKIFGQMNAGTAAKLCALYQECTGESLKDALTSCKDYFVHARYPYEPDHAHPYTISSIRNLAEGLIEALQKGWGRSQA